MVRVELRKNESQGQLLKRFRKKVTRSKVLSAVRRKRWHKPKSELKRMRLKKAIQRENRRKANKRRA